MIPAEAIPHHALASPHWEARLGLEYVKRAERTVLARRSHSGPLRVQRDLYPEGEGTCHTIVVHPPGGVAGGDSLSINVALGPGCAALLTTPGAGKWYRTQARPARQALEFDVADGASLEWLPQETILFDGASAEMKTTIRLERGAVYTGWEILCFGRTASGHRFETGRLCQQTNILSEDVLLWAERVAAAGSDALFSSPVGLAGHSVCGTLLAAGLEIPNESLASCRDVPAGPGAKCGVTRLPRILIGRWLGDSSEDARAYFAALWAVLRPVLKHSAAVAPRIWST